MMDNKIFEIWCEGYSVTGGPDNKALFLGRGEGETFNQACVNFFSENKNFSDYFNPDKLTYWGCKLFDNEADARKSFG